LGSLPFILANKSIIPSRGSAPINVPQIITLLCWTELPKGISNTCPTAAVPTSYEAISKALRLRQQLWPAFSKF
jgi:hypothetical protein